MAQLRRDYALFTEQQAEILVIGPEGKEEFKRYWDRNSLPFIGLPDPKHLVANLYQQEVKLLKGGRMPALMVIDRNGRIRYSHHGSSMSDIPQNNVILDLIEELNREE